MRPRPVYRLDLADDSFFKIKAALAPAENFRDRRFPFQRPVDRVPHRAVREVNLAVAAARFERETSAALAQAANLQNLGRRKLIQIPDRRMAGIDPFRRSATLGEGFDEGLQLFAQAPFVAVARNPGDLLLLRRG